MWLMSLTTLNSLSFLMSGLTLNYFMNPGWGGGSLLVESEYFLSLLYLTLVVALLVSGSEKSKGLLFLAKSLILLCYFFFVPSGVLLLYFLFEMSLFPILLAIIFFGGQMEKLGAAYYLTFYTALCALPLLYVLLSLSGLGAAYVSAPLSVEGILFLSLAFMMKFPVYFLHYWLPKAHVEAPTSASILLAGLLLKLGGVGLIRVLGSSAYLHYWGWVMLGLVGCSLAPLICSFQSDLKSLAAYSSVVHMNFIFSMEEVNTSLSSGQGVLMLLLHGYFSAVLFYVVGVIYHSAGSRKLYYLSGVSGNTLLAFALTWVLISNSGLPPLLSFFPELFGFSALVGNYWGSLALLLAYFFISLYYHLFLFCHAMGGGSGPNLAPASLGPSLTLLAWGVGYPLLGLLL